ncbi:variant erythrocyte surface antigen-1 family protein [Babesia caballi]|uniref:Variant erythrocyte surface antigen-1 family protein n=1 Tax=Babesia caballi TaxID=5871 RepID=A0AAV4LUB9_BABCB|nr:variant erythrocyte surface antigen-1 family protein [Babesia caballi]
MGEKEKLTDWPDNLKDVIDWFLRVGGNDTGNQDNDKSAALKNAVHQLEGHQAVKSALGNGDLPGLFRKVAEALQGFIGYDGNGNHPMTDKGIGRKDHYTSSYSTAAKWENTLNTPDSEEAQKAAKCFLCYMPILYLCIIYLYWKCSNSSHGGWGTERVNGNHSGLNIFMSAMGFKPSSELQNKSGYEIANLLTNDPLYGFEELKKPAKNQYSYPGFLENIKTYGESNISKPANCPLYALYKASTTYLMSRHTDTEEPDKILAEIKQKLQAFYMSFKSDQDLRDAISDFISTCMTTPKKPEPPPAASPPSSAGPVAGTLSTLGLGAGAAAAYMFNVGGAKTLVNGLLRIDPSFDSPSNLKEAIDWILRVTGKDGGGGDNGGTAALTEQVEKLLSEVAKSDANFGAEIKKVMSALDGGQLIAKLAEGLRQFIGYDGSSTIKEDTNGIGLYNDPLERLKTGVLVFVYGILKTLNDGKHLNGVQAQAAIGTIMKGKTNFNDSVKSELTLTANGNSNFQNVLDALKKVNEFNGKSDRLSQLAEAFKTYLGKVLQAVVEDSNVTGATIQAKDDVKNLVTDLKTNFEKVVTQLSSQNASQPIDFRKGNLKTHMDKIYSGSDGVFKKLHDAVNPNSAKVKDAKAKALVYAVYVGASFSMSQLQRGYKSYYQGAEWHHSWNKDKSSEAVKCAKIFLSCIPLIFSNMQHLYWKCKQDKAQGGWEQMQLNGSGGQGADLKQFMDLMTYSSVRLNGTMTGDKVESVMKTAFTEFSTAASGQSYAGFLKTFRDEGLKAWKDSHNGNENFLSGLYLCSTSYFRHQHQKKAATARPPSSIREMIYWLMGLTATPQFGDLLGHIYNVIGSDFHVAVSGSPKSNETLSADQVTSYILSTCYTCPSVLNVIQGSVPPNGSGDEPWLHELYSNAAFPFKYPSSGAALFYGLSDYTYALQFQLHFLYQQCSNFANTCGWRDCRYGSDIQPKQNSNVTVSSHICHAGCTHNSGSSGPCNHDGIKCGKGSNLSPLQAFLTDGIQGMCRQHPGSSDHLSTCSGGLCHVKMGFNPNDLRTASNANTQGENICLTLRPLCGGFNTPLRQLSEKLGCLTKRTPRTLGDLFGFMWHLNGQLFGNTELKMEDFVAKLVKPFADTQHLTVPQFILDLLKPKASGAFYSSTNATGLSLSLEAIAPAIPFLYQLFKGNINDFFPSRLYHLKGAKHDSNHSADLFSLFNSDCSNPNTCGKYLYPITHSDGATYAPRNASSYLSWVLYLSDDLQSWFQEMLDEFKNIDCSTLGCVKCTSHKAGTHGTPSVQCSCDSVVQCGGTLPLLYRHGFRYFNPAVLMGGSSGSHQSKRNCKAFADQLQSVISGDPLSNLLTSIDDFLYAIRWEFFSKLSGFWTIYVRIILYTFFFLLDTLRVRSHLHFPSSNSIAPISLLGTGKAPALKNFPKLTYFMP